MEHKKLVPTTAGFPTLAIHNTYWDHVHTYFTYPKVADVGENEIEGDWCLLESFRWPRNKKERDGARPGFRLLNPSNKEGVK